MVNFAQGFSYIGSMNLVRGAVCNNNLSQLESNVSECIQLFFLN